METIQISQINKEEFRTIIKDVMNEVLEKNSNETPINTSDDLIKIDEVSKLLQVSEVTIHKWKKDGLIPFHKLNRRLYFKKSEVMDSLRNINPKKR
jgi:excisionase family DNA binding protein